MSNLDINVARNDLVLAINSLPDEYIEQVRVFVNNLPIDTNKGKRAWNSENSILKSDQKIVLGYPLGKRDELYD